MAKSNQVTKRVGILVYLMLPLAVCPRPVAPMPQFPHQELGSLLPHEYVFGIITIHILGKVSLMSFKN